MLKSIKPKDIEIGKEYFVFKNINTIKGRCIKFRSVDKCIDIDHFIEQHYEDVEFTFLERGNENDDYSLKLFEIGIFYIIRYSL